tara:strand:- start:3 stop:287 length:285 start_codon:yes stop_codon:yes gene_type:complete
LQFVKYKCIIEALCHTISEVLRRDFGIRFKKLNLVGFGLDIGTEMVTGVELETIIRESLHIELLGLLIVEKFLMENLSCINAIILPVLIQSIFL